MELSICSWQNYKKIGPILAIKNDEFYQDYVAEKLIKISNKDLNNINIKGLATTALI